MLVTVLYFGQCVLPVCSPNGLKLSNMIDQCFSEYKLTTGRNQNITSIKISSLVPRFCIYVRVSVDGDYTLPAPPQTKLATGYSMGILSRFTRFWIGSNYPWGYPLLIMAVPLF